MAENLPNRLKEIRKARGLGQAEVGELVGCTAMHVSALERGERTLTLDWMRRFARVYGVEPADLLSRSDNSATLSPDEERLLRIYRSAPGDKRQQLLRMAEILVPEAA